MIYTPDRWVVLNTYNEEGTLSKVFAGWYGGFTTSDSWKLNSGIVSTIETDDYYEFTGYSGSIYRCYKANYGMSNAMHIELNYWYSEIGNRIAINEEYMCNI